MTQKEKIALIGKHNDIQTHDAFGKYLVLNDILKNMGEEKANKFMEDTLMMLDLEIDDLFSAYGFEDNKTPHELFEGTLDALASLNIRKDA